MNPFDNSQRKIIFCPIDYENSTFQDFFLKYEFEFVRCHKSLYFPNSFEFDISLKKKVDLSPIVVSSDVVSSVSMSPTLFILRTPICKIVYFNKMSNKAIFQISNPQNKISEKFIIFINEMQEKYQIDSEFNLVKQDSRYKNFSLILDLDSDGFSWFDRNGIEKDTSCNINSDKPNVVGMLYLDKKIILKSDSAKTQIGFRWRLFQLREIFLVKQKCLIKLKIDQEKDDDIFHPFPTVSSFPPPPPPPPPLPPVFKLTEKIIIRKKEIINKIKKESNQNFVVSQDELLQVLKKMKAKEIL